MANRTAEQIRDHVGYWMKPGQVPSDEALRVAALLEEWQGLHHLEDAEMRKADWTRQFVELSIRPSSMSTFDFDDLTRLVFLAHDHCIRADVGGARGRGGGCRIMFHPRVREGSMSVRHPTLEQAVAAWRENHSAEANTTPQVA